VPSVYAEEEKDLPTAADLAETVEVVIDEEIKELAASLDNNPVKIYEYVRNNFIFVPTWGSIQGNKLCLWNKAGNAFDIASVLISLLRAAGYPSRYVIGEIELPFDKVCNWVGVKEPKIADALFYSGGIPGQPYTQGGKYKILRTYHVWVKTYITYDHNLGAVQTDSHKHWVNLDPSYKQYEYTEGVEIAEEVPFDAEGFLNELGTTAIVDKERGSFTKVDLELIRRRIEGYQTEVTNYLEENYPGYTGATVTGTRKLKELKLGVIPDSLPYRIRTKFEEYSSLPTQYKHRLGVEIKDEWGDTDFYYSGDLAELGTKRITLSYTPATEEDRQLIEALIPESENPEDYPESLPAYLIKVKPELKVDGEVVASGSEIGLGREQKLCIEFSGPFGSGRTENRVKAGAFQAIGLDLLWVPKEIHQKLVAELESTKEALEAKVVDLLTKDKVLGLLLHTAAMHYFSKLDILNTFAAWSYRVANIRVPSEVITGFDLSVEYLFMVPRIVKLGGIVIDADRNLEIVFAQDGDKLKQKLYTIHSGMTSSALEYDTLERIFGGEAISATKALQIANNEGIPIHTIYQENISEVMPYLQLPEDIKGDIRNAVNAGMAVMVPEREITFGKWQGVGYIVMDQETGSAVYMLSGGIAGGWLMLYYAVLGVAALLVGWAAAPGVALVFGIGLAVELILLAWIEIAVDYIAGEISKTEAVTLGIIALLYIGLGYYIGIKKIPTTMYEKIVYIIGTIISAIGPEIIGRQVRE
jgi:hypothetical protein